MQTGEGQSSDKVGGGDRRQEKGDADLKVPKREIFVTELY